MHKGRNELSMKIKIKIAIAILMMILVVFGIIFIISSNIEPQITTTSLYNYNLSAQNIETVKILDKMEFGKEHAFGDGDLESDPNHEDPGINQFVWSYVYNTGRELYCIEQGGTINTQPVSPEELISVLEEDSTGSQHKGCASSWKGAVSRSHWECEEHIMAMPDLAYILSEPTSYGNGADIDKYVLRKPDNENEDLENNEFDPIDLVVEQTGKYNRIHDLYEKFINSHVINGQVIYKEGTINYREGGVEDSDYYSVYNSIIGRELFTSDDWRDWIDLCWPIERDGARYRRSRSYHQNSYKGITVPSGTASTLREKYSAWHTYMVFNSSEYKSWKNWVNRIVPALTYEQYYEYYRYAVEQKGAVDEYVIDENGNFEVVETDFNENGEYEGYKFINALGYSRYVAGIEQETETTTYSKLYVSQYNAEERDKRYQDWIFANSNKVLDDDYYYNAYAPYCDAFTREDWNVWRTGLDLSSIDRDDYETESEYNDAVDELEHNEELAGDYDKWRRYNIVELENSNYIAFKNKMDTFITNLKKGNQNGYYGYYYGYVLAKGYQYEDFIDGQVSQCNFYRVMGAVIKYLLENSGQGNHNDNSTNINVDNAILELWVQLEVQNDIIEKNEDFVMFPNKTKEPNQIGATEIAPQDDLNNGVVAYYINEQGAILHKYHYGENVGPDIRQYAIWLRYGKGDNICVNTNGISFVKRIGFYNMAKALLQEAEDYEDFGAALDENANSEDESKRNNLMGLTNQTDRKIVQVTNRKEDTDDDGQADTDYLTIGPLKMEYIEGIGRHETHFGGISKMWVEGYNVYGDIVEVNGSTEIEVESFILDTDISDDEVNGYEYEADYFTPNRTTKSFTDITEQVYPRSGEWFYIKIKNPNSSIESNDVRDLVKSVDVKIQFQWMRTEVEVCKLHGGQDQIVYKDCEHPGHCCHSCTSEDCSHDCSPGGCCHDCDFTKKIQEYNIKSQDAIDGWGSRTLYEQEVSLFGTDEKESLLDITMKLGGYVWEDTPSGKETAIDGLRIINSVDADIDDSTEETMRDKALENVRVTLYEYKDGNSNLATLIVDPMEEDILDAEQMHRVNSTLTDENGYYQFNGLDTSKRYYVVFEYNGQRYMPTDYLRIGEEQENSISAMLPMYNTDPWYQTSKTLESANERDDYDTDRFAEISSYPNNYKSSDSLEEVGEYNAAYTQIDLMGYKLNDDGNYEQTEPQLIDGYTYNSRGLETRRYVEGEITKRIKEYIKENGKYPNTIEEIKEVYNSIAEEYSDDDEIWNKLQFIEDCKMQAYTTSKDSLNNPLSGTDLQLDLYPIYDEVVVQPILTEEEMNQVIEQYKPNADFVQVYDGWVERGSLTFIIVENNGENEIVERETVRYNGIYDGQFYINCGLWRRQEFDLALKKDVYKAALKINDKTEIYTYDKRLDLESDESEDTGKNNESGQDNNSYWDINVRMSNYNDSNSYYGLNYSREIYNTDYIFRTTNDWAENHQGEPLEIYITYKITIKNQSMSVMGEIQEVVDYYDDDYIYKPNLSWVTYRDGNNTSTAINSNSYYDMMEQDQEVIDEEETSPSDFISNARDIDSSDRSIYRTESDITDEYEAVYINGLQGKKLGTGEYAYIYLTFQVDKDSNNRVIVDEENSRKENLAEIRGYITYYANNTELPNDISKNSSDIAGLLDRDSNPGNLVLDDLQDDRYEKNFEDDTDRAPTLRVFVEDEAIRQVNGIVWEDKRNNTVVSTEDSSDAIIGDGIRDEDETGIKGVTVQLVEKCTDGSEYIWYETTTNDAGRYDFMQFVPGDYIIRFYYGDTDDTALGEVNGGENVVAYNGQDFKSTIYQTGIDQEGNTDILGRYQGYIYTDSQNVSGTYNANQGRPTDDTFGYNIYESDEAMAEGANYSDAKDIWSTANRDSVNILGPFASTREVQGRQAVIEYSNGIMQNEKAEILASAYEKPVYNEREYTETEMEALYNELINNTYMTAETGIIAVEFEYDRQQTDGYNTTTNNADTSSKNYIGDNARNGVYILNNVDLGLVERPKAQLEIDKSVANVEVTLANGSILFDINEAANNAIWQDHKEYSIDEEKLNDDDDGIDFEDGEIGMYEEHYGDDNLNRYSFRTDRYGIEDIIQSTDKGLIQLTIDQEIMHGATIQITYTVKITNVGEVDYVDGDSKNFYYKGDTSGASIVTTTANQVVDYVANNLQFDSNNNVNTQNGWSIITAENLVDAELINNRLSDELEEFNAIVTSEDFGNEQGQALKPGEEISKTIVLSQLITPENTSDDLTYENMVEIVKTTNAVGRRMAYSVVGNQDPLEDPAEVDSNVAERIIILPPFGEQRIYYILGAVVALILIGGVILIRKKVLKSRK